MADEHVGSVEHFQVIDAARASLSLEQGARHFWAHRALARVVALLRLKLRLSTPVRPKQNNMKQTAIHIAVTG